MKENEKNYQNNNTLDFIIKKSIKNKWKVKTTNIISTSKLNLIKNKVPI